MDDHPLTLSVKRLPFLLTSVQFIDISTRKSSSSEVNLNEIDFISRLITYFQQNDILNDRITILTPYRKQKSELIRRLGDVPIFTIDEYQGEENEIIVVSLTNAGKSPSSFLCDPRRLNVLTSRSKRGFIICGDLQSFMRSVEWAQLIDVMITSQKNELSSRWGNASSKFNDYHHFHVLEKLNLQPNNSCLFSDWRSMRSLSEFDQFLNKNSRFQHKNKNKTSPKIEEDDIEWINAHLNTLDVK